MSEQEAERSIVVEYVDDGRLGNSGNPLADGWWYFVTAGPYRNSGRCNSEQEAWRHAAGEGNSHEH